MNLKEELTQRELEVFLACCQFPNKQAADSIGMKEDTLKHHYIYGLSRKLGGTHRGQWMKIAIQQGLLTV